MEFKAEHLFWVQFFLHCTFYIPLHCQLDVKFPFFIFWNLFYFKNDSSEPTNEEKLKYREKITSDLEKLLHLADEKPFRSTANASNIAPDVFNSRSKNISSAHILNSITNSLNTKIKKRSSKSVTNQIESPMVNDLGVSEMVYINLRIKVWTLKSNWKFSLGI